MGQNAVDALENLRGKRAEAYARLCPGRLNGCRAGDVRNVLLIDGASRCGSSFLHHLLARHPDVVSLNGEGVSFEKLHGIGLPRSAEDSDALEERAVPAEIRASVADAMLRDAGVPHAAADGTFPGDEYLADSVQRLILQYPEIDFGMSRLVETCGAALERSGVRSAAASAEDSAVVAYWLEVLRELSRRGAPVDRRHYDLRGSDPAADFPESGNAHPPPFSRLCLEEPPFVVPRPRRLPAPSALRAKTLLLKSSSNCYHLRLIKRLFPDARFRFLVLTRNPAAAISGLMDGWLSNAFHSRAVDAIAPLEIGGYSRDELPWTKRWWKFDLPPGWADYRRAPLEEVCAHQWASANEHVLRDLEDGTIGERLLVRYESFLEPSSLAAELARIADFAGLAGPALSDAGSARVMSVAPPAPQKWRKRRELLAPVLTTERIRSVAERLGYNWSARDAWP